MKYKFFSILVALILVAGVAFVWAGGKQEEEAMEAPMEAPMEEETMELPKVALLLDGTITDGGWNQSPYEGLMMAGEDFDIEVSYTDMIPPNEIPIVMRDYANKGFSIIIGNGYTFLDALASVSPDYPDTMFIGLSIPNAGPNWMSARQKYGQGGHIVGLIMAALTQSNKVAWTSAFEAPHDNAEKNAVREYLEKHRPEVELLSAYSGDWADVTKAKQAVLAVVDQGADIIVNTLASEEALAGAARERGDFLIIGWPGESMAAGPDVILTSVILDTSIVVYETIKACLEGGYKPGTAFHFGMATGAVRVGEMNEDLLSADLMARIEAEVQGIIDGSITPNTTVVGWD